MAINLAMGEFFGRFLQNYRSYSFAAWYSDHEAMETLATAATSDSQDSGH